MGSHIGREQINLIRTMKKLAGGSPFVEDWKNVVIELYVDESVRMKGEVVGGVRIKEEPPKTLSVAEVKQIVELVKKETTLEGLHGRRVWLRTIRRGSGRRGFARCRSGARPCPVGSGP